MMGFITFLLAIAATAFQLILAAVSGWNQDWKAVADALLGAVWPFLYATLWFENN
jgi:hypothetical protein